MTNVTDPIEAETIAFLTPRKTDLVNNHEGLSNYQLQVLIKLTGSKAVIRTYRRRMSAIGPYGRNEDGIVV
jgi:hypothetical protein